MHTIFAASSKKERLNFLLFHWPCMHAYESIYHAAEVAKFG